MIRSAEKCSGASRGLGGSDLSPATGLKCFASKRTRDIKLLLLSFTPGLSQVIWADGKWPGNRFKRFPLSRGIA